METNNLTLTEVIAKSRELFAQVAAEQAVKDAAITSVFAQNDARRAYMIARRATRKANQVVSPMQAYLYGKP